MTEKVTMYVTKYALSAGKVQVMEGKASDNELFYPDGRSYNGFWVGRECFTDPSDAAKDAEKRKAKKIASIKRQLAKLEQLRFDTI